ncbi:MAG: hypothetical protein HY868_11510 [Chloroflexi bacterium]|nr:hypothetical protein [Chloroflexota bacterium]
MQNVNRKSFIQIETRTGAPIALNGREIRVQSRAISLNLPFGGAVWNRPTSVIVRTRDGNTQTLAVRDVTRLAQLLIAMLCIAGAIFVALNRRTRE